ncbi:MAG: hypothetical protein HKP08_01995 [Flavobacteriaceae bacterium]|nr:hypothetical protein [Flavobacteriaceae bacterium]
MNRLFKQPHLFFFPASIVLVALGFIVPLSNFAFNIEDTYYVVQGRWVYHLLALFGFLIALVYWIMHSRGKTLRYRLNAMHVGTSFLGPILIFISTLFYKEVRPLQATEDIGLNMEMLEAYQFNNSVRMVILALVTITLVIQLVFPVNILMAFLDRREEQKD